MLCGVYALGDCIPPVCMSHFLISSLSRRSWEVAVPAAGSVIC